MERLTRLLPHFGVGEYAVFYLLGFIIGGMMIFWAGFRRKFPILSWLVVLNGCALGAIVGSKLLVISPESFLNSLSQLTLPLTMQKTYLGGLLGGIAGVYVTRRWVGFRFSVLDAFAFALPIALAIGRLGCLFGGCCFGTPTHLPWGIAYPPDTLPYLYQLANSIIPSGASASLPVHPTPLYEILFCGAILLILSRVKSYLNAPGNLFYTSIALYGMFRFAEEFLRQQGALMSGLKGVQWGLLVAIPVVIAWIFYQEKKWRRTAGEIRVDSKSISSLFAIMGMIMVFIFLGRHWFTPLETTVLLIFSLPTLVILIITALHVQPLPGKRRVLVSILTAGALLVALQTDEPAPSRAFKDSSYITIGVGGMTGKYQETCGPVHTYDVAGGSVAYTRQLSKYNSYTLKLRGYVGEDKNDGKLPIRAINPFAEWNSRWIGVGAGAHVGDLVLDGELLNTKLMFAGKLRFGQLRHVFLNARVGDHDPGSFPSGFIKLGLGFGFGDKSGSNVQIGISDAGYYINPYIVLPDQRVILSPYLSGAKETYQVGLNLVVRFPKR